MRGHRPKRGCSGEKGSVSRKGRKERKGFMSRYASQSDLLHADSILSSVGMDMESEFQADGKKWSQDQKQKYARDQAILTQAGSILRKRAEPSMRNPSS